LRALQILGAHGIAADNYVQSPHSVSLFVPVERHEEAVRTLHRLLRQP
jgi:aspartate kinase